jgi:hypothetical protein
MRSEQVYAALGHGYSLHLEGAVESDFTDSGIQQRGNIYFQWYAQTLQALLDGDLSDDGAGRLWLRAQTLNRLSAGVHALEWKK